MPIQFRRTSVPDHAPDNLVPGQLAVEMASDPLRLWVGVPTSIDPTGRREIGGANVLPPSLLAGQSRLRGHPGVHPAIYDFGADLVMVRNPIDNDGKIIHGATASCNITSPGIGGSDLGVGLEDFAGWWIHFYWIYDPDNQELAAIASLNAPSDGGPALPPRFTHWCYIGPVINRDGGGLLPVHILGDKFFYFAGGENYVLGDGWATDPTGFYVGLYVPPNANDYDVLFWLWGNWEGGNIAVQVDYGVDFVIFGTAPWMYSGSQATFPNSDVQYLWYYDPYYYIAFPVVSDAVLSCAITGYSVANGAT